MRNVSKDIREVYNNKLSNIVYNGNRVPNYITQPSGTLPDQYIELGEINTTNVLNDSKWISEVSVTIEVITAQYKYQNKDVADDIAQLILNEVIPTIGGSLINNYFWIGHVQLESTRYLDEIDGQGMYITRKILIFTQTLIEK